MVEYDELSSEIIFTHQYGQEYRQDIPLHVSCHSHVLTKTMPAWNTTLQAHIPSQSISNLWVTGNFYHYWRRLLPLLMSLFMITAYNNVVSEIWSWEVRLLTGLLVICYWVVTFYLRESSAFQGTVMLLAMAMANRLNQYIVIYHITGWSQC